MARRSNTPSASGRRRRDDGNKKPLIIAAIVVILAGIAWYSYKTMFPNKHHLPYDGVVQSVDQNGTLILKNGLKVQLLGITANNRTIEFLNANVIGKNVHLIPQFGITECLIQYKCSENTPPPYAIRSG